jgi:hypothetical protein
VISIRWLSLGLTAMVVISFFLGYLGGGRSAVVELASDPQTAYSLKAQVARLEEALKESRGQVEMLQTRHEVDSQAQEFLRLEIAGHKEQMSEIQEGLRFYRSLMSPDDIATGLSIREPELMQSDRAGAIAFRVVAQQEARRHKLIEGKLTVEVSGMLNGEQVTYPLSELSRDYSEDAMKIKFRYFQTIEGEFELPVGFEPSDIYVLAKARKPQKVEVGQRFPWKLQERMTHVGE